MQCNGAKGKQAIGFLTVLEDEQHGLFGGYLLLNLAGRPLEFHCTAPVKANRAQQILYGPTLDAFLYGEQIGGTLLEQAKIDPLVVFTDRAPALAVRDLVSVPVALVLAEGQERQTPEVIAAETATNGQKSLRIDAPHRGIPPLISFQVGRNRLAVAKRVAADREQIVERMAEIADTFDLAEPFTRIREAIEEAQQAAR